MTMHGTIRIARIAVLLATILCLGFPGVSAAWLSIIDATPFSDRGVAVVGDAAGNVVAGGEGKFTVVKLRQDTGVELWRYELESDTSAVVTALAVDGAGDVIAAGRLLTGDLRVVKLSLATGDELWSYTRNGALSSSSGAAIAVDASGDVVAVGRAFGFTAVKLDGANGAELWSQDLGIGGEGGAVAVAIDASADVVAGGHIVGGDEFAVVKFSGATGAILWQYGTVAFPTEGVAAVAVDGNGDVVAAGEAINNFVVVKLGGTSGNVLWQRVIDGTEPGDVFRSDVALAIDLDSAGNVIVGGHLQNAGTSHDFVVMKRDGVTGAERWRVEVAQGGNEAAGVREQARSVAVVDDDVVAVGDLASGSGAADTEFTVMRLDGSDGTEIWRHQLDGTGSGVADSAHAVALGADGAVAAVGTLKTGSFSDSIAVARINGSVRGRKLTVRDGGVGKRKLTVRSDADPTTLVPTAGGPGDPTVGGGALRLLNPTSAEEVELPLPAVGWKGLGDPQGSKGYQYKDSGRVFGPCKKVLLKDSNKGPRLKATCTSRPGGPTLEFSLDEPAQGALAVELTTGSQNVRNCVRFGGTISSDGPGSFRAKDAPPPALCSQASPSGGFLDEDSSLLD